MSRCSSAQSYLAVSMLPQPNPSDSLTGLDQAPNAVYNLKKVINARRGAVYLNIHYTNQLAKSPKQKKLPNRNQVKHTSVVGLRHLIWLLLWPKRLLSAFPSRSTKSIPSNAEKGMRNLLEGMATVVVSGCWCCRWSVVIVGERMLFVEMSISRRCVCVRARGLGLASRRQVVEMTVTTTVTTAQE